MPVVFCYRPSSSDCTVWEALGVCCLFRHPPHYLENKINDRVIVSTKWPNCNVSDSGETDHGRHWTKDREGGGRLLVVVQGQQEEGGGEIIFWKGFIDWISVEGCCQCSELPVPEMPGSGTLDLWLHWHQEVSFFYNRIITVITAACYAGVSILRYFSRTLLIIYSHFYKKLGPFYKKLNCETMVTDHRPVRTTMHLTSTNKALKRHLSACTL